MQGIHLKKFAGMLENKLQVTFWTEGSSLNLLHQAAALVSSRSDGMCQCLAGVFFFLHERGPAGEFPARLH